MTASLHGFALPTPIFSTGPTAIARAIAQVSFGDRWWMGIVLFLSTVAIAPWSAAGLAVGAAIGVVAGFGRGAVPRREWEAGLTGVNPAIVGIAWGGVLARGEATAWLLPFALLVCVGLDSFLRPKFREWNFPLLGASAVVTIWGSIFVFQSFGISFWAHPGVVPFGPWGVAVCVAGVAIILASVCFSAAVVTAALTAIAVVGSGIFFYAGWVGPSAYWAFTVAPAIFAVHGIFLAGSRLGAVVGAAAALIASAAWALWIYSPLDAYLAPVLAPCFLGIWLTLFWTRKRFGLEIADPMLWDVARKIRRAKTRGRKTVVLAGAGMGVASGIPDYINGHWLNPNIPVEEYAFGRFLVSSQARRNYWDACEWFRETVDAARPNSGHLALTALEKKGWLDSVVTQNVDRLQQQAGSKAVVDLHGRIDIVGCLQCGWTGPWPDPETWRSESVHCPECGGLVKPRVIAMGEDITPATWRAAETAIMDCGVVLVVGSQMAISSAVSLLALARKNHADVVVISIGVMRQPTLPEDITIAKKAEDVLPALAILLDCKAA